MFFELFGDVYWSRSGNLNPCLGEKGTSAQDKQDVENSLDRIQKCLLQIERRLHVVGETGDGKQLLTAACSWLPCADESDNEVVWESREEHLGDDEDIGGQSALEHNWHVGGIEQSDWVDIEWTSLSGGLDWQVDSEALQVDNEREDNQGCKDLRHVWSVVSVEGVDQRSSCARSGEEHVYECQDGAFKLGASASVDKCWGKAFPDNGLANLGRHEQGGTRAEPVALLEQFVQKNDH